MGNKYDRIIEKSPKNLVENGISKFGTFDSLIENINIRDTKKPVKAGYANSFKNTRLKEWEAFEINFKEGFLVGAIYSIGYAISNVMFFYDKRTNTIVSNQEFGRFKKGAIKPSLADTINYYKTRNIEIEIRNNFKNGKCIINSTSSKKKNSPFMQANVEITSVAKPSVVVLPLDENRPLYTHKELFSVEGKIKIGDEVFIMDENSTCVIDDHKAFYPFSMHYDWITCFEKNKQGKLIGFNLTKNQVKNQIKYNENYVWSEGELIMLPPVEFEKFKNKWHIYDVNKEGIIDLYFDINNAYKVKANAGLFKINYIAPFGKISGKIKIKEQVFDFTEFCGFAEDKTYRM